MKKWIEKIWKPFALNNQRIYFGEIEDWEESIRWLGDPSIMLKEKNEYILSPNSSTGVLSGRIMFAGRKRADIAVFAKLTLMEPGKYHVQFTAPFRPEHILIAMGGPVGIIAAAISGAPWGVYIFIPLIWIFGHLWFHFILRAQEDWVVEELTKKLRLYKLGKDIA